MTDMRDRRIRPTVVGAVQTAVCLALFYVAVLTWIEPHLVHQRFLSRSLEFSRSWTHFTALLSRTGGLVTYASGHLFQYYAYAWAGALVMTLAALGVTVATGALLRAAPRSLWRAVRFVPALGLLVLWSQYDNPLAFGLGLLVALAGAGVYVRGAPTSRWFRLAVYLALCPVVLYAAGWAWLVGYAVFCGVTELRGRRRLHAVVALAGGAGVSAVAAWPLVASGVGPAWDRLRGFLGDGAAVGSLFVVEGRLTLTTVALALAAFYAAVAVWGRGRVKPSPASESPRSESQPPGPAARRRAARRAKAVRSGPAPASVPRWRHLRGPVLRWTLQTVAVLVVAAAATVPLFDGEKKLWLELGHAYRCRLWPRLLAAARRLPVEKHNPLVTHDVNRALYHTGRLPHEMFSYPQNPYGLLLLSLKDTLGKDRFDAGLYERIADSFYELGRLNDAEHWSHELLQLRGDHPATLQLLAKINVIKEQPTAARTFLGYLADLRNDRETAAWARAWLRRMDDDPLLADQEEVRRLRPLRLLEDSMTPTRTVEADLLALLRRNPHNRMAFEYLMAHYLLTCRVGHVAANLHRLDDFDYAGIPRHWEEAVLLYQRGSRRPADLHGRRIRPETIQRFEGLNRKLARYPAGGPGRQAGLDMLRTEYGASYFSYYMHYLPHVIGAAKESR